MRALTLAVSRLQAAAEQTRAAAPGRSAVDLAIGVLAERLGLTPVEAAAQLAELARAARVPVAVLAADIVGQGAGSTPSRVAEPAETGSGGGGPVEFGEGAPGDLREVGAGVLDQVLGVLGAEVVLVWQVLPDGALGLAAQAGLTAGEAVAWGRVPPGVRTAAAVVASGEEEWWPDRPGAGEVSVRSGARVVVPLTVGGRRRGALEVVWPGAAPVLGTAERRQLYALADLCATLLGEPGPVLTVDGRVAVVDGLLEAALLLDPVSVDGVVVDFVVRRVSPAFRDPLGRPVGELLGVTLAEAYPVACGSGLFDWVLRAHAAGVARPPEELRLVFRTGAFTTPTPVRLAAAPLGGGLLLSWRLDPERVGAEEQNALLRQAQRLARVAGFEEEADTGRLRWTEGLAELYGLSPHAAPPTLDRLAGLALPDDRAAVRRLADTVRHGRRVSSAVFRTARPDGGHRYVRVVAEPLLDGRGRLTGVRGACQDVSALHRTEVALGATRARLADSEQQTADSERLALALQTAILPVAPPPLGELGLRAAVRYRPAAQWERVGGDWYDVLVLPDQRVLLAVGDVAGHGLVAATGMVALRHALRGLAVTGAGPGQLLEWANRVALREPGQVTATAVCVLFDPADGRLRWARAGHLPPVRYGAEGGRRLPLPQGVLLGALEEAEYEERTAHLGRGEVLLLYTDGLVERRDRPVEESVDELVRAAGAPGPELEAYLDRLLALSPSDTEDDTCLVAVGVI
ncbi:hypothetical protein CFP65_7091 [Kitasatospora sp. MMS16-BH015]|nr:hypothetical protein CFP65_7091 [Kitasatospora sp. MMS16-BH015]